MKAATEAITAHHGTVTNLVHDGPATASFAFLAVPLRSSV
jgi:hypothetical protein